MYFLDGERLYIKPENGCKLLESQIQSCLQQIRKINSEKRIFKLNFFVDANSKESYDAIKGKVSQEVQKQFSESILLSFFAQPPLTCKIIVEAFFYDYTLWDSEFVSNGFGCATLFRRDNTEVLVGNVQANLGGGCKENAERAFAGLAELFSEFKFPVNSIIRQWNYLEDILGFDIDKQRYQEFNDVRSGFYADNFNDTGFPAATGIGMNRGGVIIEFVALKSEKAATKPVDNPEQIAAHHYSKDVLVGEECILKTTPKFERARYLELFGKKMVFISGTASIIGENTVGVGDPEKQTEVTIKNIRRLYSPEVLDKISDENLAARYGHARVYIKKRQDFHAIKRTFKKFYGNLPVVYIIADICRNDLLVEIEGKVILE
ncbi:hypothetical protein GM418_22385 [Maribellus comscasis]|uniref:Chorismatase FkbO/Hyg5-like N-terminal domain-containing protein n=1 Tax=Maribellus comscasis TaxID=2681766 RepID=A0A6I6JYT6_9BACT|nr:hypothetical protein [Maribellus comscasis]QGY46310.1 hypothetical protein GM418_22385 [Maribellus comscasis]